MDPIEPLRVAGPSDFHRMPQEYQELLVYQMTIHAAGELSGADDYVKWFYPIAPNARERRACCRFAVDEMNHYMRTARVLGRIGVDVSYLLEQRIDERVEYRTELVRGVRSWAERAMVSFLGEAAVFEILLELEQSSYAPFAALFPRILREESRHIAHARSLVVELCRTGAGRSEAQEALERFWPISLDLFGSSNSERSERYRKWGLRRTSNAEARERFIRNHAPKVERLGLRVPPSDCNRRFL